MEVLVFKTNIRYKKHIGTVQPMLDKIEGLKRWNIDLHDKDKILRVEANNIKAAIIQTAVIQAGYECEELED
jgi:hypothetical protein